MITRLKDCHRGRREVWAAWEKEKGILGSDTLYCLKVVS